MTDKELDGYLVSTRFMLKKKNPLLGKGNIQKESSARTLQQIGNWKSGIGSSISIKFFG